jgi:hypothetical protein
MAVLFPAFFFPCPNWFNEQKFHLFLEIGVKWLCRSTGRSMCIVRTQFSAHTTDFVVKWFRAGINNTVSVHAGDNIVRELWCLVIVTSNCHKPETRNPGSVSWLTS